MILAEIFIEHPVRAVDQVFTYESDVMLEKGERVEVNFNNRFLVGFVHSCIESSLSRQEYEKQAGYKIKKIHRIIDTESLLNDELYALADYMKDITLSTTISCYQAMLPTILKPSSSNSKIQYEKWVVPTEEKISLTPKQLDAYMYVVENQTIKYSLLRAKYPSIAKKLVDSGALKIIEKEKEGNTYSTVKKSLPLELT